METLIFKDNNNNGYLYSPFKRKLIYLNPILYIIVYNYLEKGHAPKISDLIRKYGDRDVSKEMKMFIFLKEKDYFKSTEEFYTMRFTPSDIDLSLSNAKQICFELTQKCNLKCTYCCYGDMYKNERDNHTCDMKLDTAFILIDTLCHEHSLNKDSYINKKIKLGFYGGEPLLKYNHIESIVAYAEEKAQKLENIQFEYIMTTNGIYLKKYIDFFIKYNFLIMVSLDGNYNHSSYRISSDGHNVFDIVFNNLNYIKHEYPTFFQNNITFNSVIHNMNSSEDVVYFFKHKFNKIPQLSEISPMLIRKDKKDIYNNMHKHITLDYEYLKDDISLEEYITADKKIKNIPHFFYNLLNININEWADLFYEHKDSSFPFNVCLPFKNKIFLSADGKLHLCEHIGYRYSYGHIDVNSKNIIYNKEAVANFYTKKISRILTQCKKCSNALSCDICIFQNRLICKAINKEQFINELIHNIDLLKKRSLFIETN